MDARQEGNIKDKGYNQALDKTLSTPLPDVNLCVEMDVDMIDHLICSFCAEYLKDDVNCVGFNSGKGCLFNESLKKAMVANSKSILKWKKVDNG